MEWTSLGLNVMLQGHVETHFETNHSGVNGILQLYVEFEVSRKPTSVNSWNNQSISIQLFSNKTSITTPTICSMLITGCVKYIHPCNVKGIPQPHSSTD